MQCAVCQFPASNKCGGCGIAYYCSKEHQKENWKAHKPICKRSSPVAPPIGSESEWARGLSPDKQAEWLVDCYRMRLDDEYTWGGRLRGIYNPGHSSDDLFCDLLIFAKLCVRKRVLPNDWNWSRFLRKASQLIKYAFEKSDAQEKWGGENVFTAVMRSGRSLRFTGEVIYENSVMTGAESKATKDVRKAIESANNDLKTNDAHYTDVGGRLIWLEFYNSL
ncbi:hypothetical protein HDU67_007605 [Dinochytrium kinnereticum]|nr:hypothetical protein HDU67_007605 [Dinochytrium kinnereticum]